MYDSSVCIQFTGGKDSTLLAALMAQEFDKVYLISFSNPLIVNLKNVEVNVRKLKQLAGEEKFDHTIISNEDLFRAIYSGQWFRDIKKYRTYSANNICSACRLAMITHTIIYCKQKGITQVRDGANRTGFDLSQQVWSLEIIKNFYQEFNINYDFSLYQSSRNDIDLLKLGLAANPPQLFYRSQPLCEGGGEIHNIYMRCYFLPQFGREARRDRDVEWLQDKMNFCRAFIAKSVTASETGPAKSVHELAANS